MDVRQTITDKIIEVLSKGQKTPWQCPFKRHPLPLNYKTNRQYRGINTLILWLESHIQGYTNNYWLGFNQARTLKAKVRKGEKGTPIIVCNSVIKDNEDEEKSKIYLFFKTEYVFNIDQIEELNFKETENNIREVTEINNIIDFHDIKIKHQGERAYYSPKDDFINMPFKSNFKDNEGYYSTLLHEMTHWTGHKDRLNRLNKFDIENRAYEELIAEIGASFLCAEFGITPNIENNASYIASWLKALSDDKNFIFKASHEATKASNFILNAQNNYVSEKLSA